MLLACSDAVEKGQGKGAAGDGFGNGKRGCGCAGTKTPGWLEMDGGKVASCGDATAGKGGLNAVAVNAFRKADYVDEPTDGAAGKG